MKEDRYHKHRLANHVLHPETLMVGYGYDPLLSEGADQAARVSHIHVRIPVGRGRARFL